MFPPHLTAILDQFGVTADTRASLYDLYRAYGPAILEVFGDWTAETSTSPAQARPEDVEPLRVRVIELYLERNHPRWLEGKPTQSLFHPAEGEGRGAGATTPLGRFSEDAGGISGEAARHARAVVGPDQPVPSGILMLSRNGHYGGRQDTVSFDVVVADPAEAKLVGRAQGRQHTLPGSVGETTGSVSGSAALIWEVQPNVLKPQGDRNREIAALYRRHRNWHVATLAAALSWLKERYSEVWILRGSALSTTHEVNPAAPVSGEISEMHDRTVSRVVEALGLALEPADSADTRRLLETSLMNTALTQAVTADGAARYISRIIRPA